MLHISTFSSLRSIGLHALLALSVVDWLTASPIVRRMAQNAPLKWLIFGENFFTHIFFWYQLCNCNLLCFQTKVVVISSLELYRRQTHALHHPQRVLLSKRGQLQTHNLMVWSGRSGNQKRSVNWSAIFIIGSKPKSTISFWWCNDHEHNCWLHLLFQ